MQSEDKKNPGFVIWTITALLAIVLVSFSFLGIQHESKLEHQAFLPITDSTQQISVPEHQRFTSAEITQPLIVMLVLFLGALAYAMGSHENGSNINQTVAEKTGWPKLCWSLTLVSWLYPSALTVSLYLTWAIAWALLGHTPLPSIDDPKQISVWLDIPYTVTLLLMIGFPLALVGGISWTAWTGVQRGLSRAAKASRLVLFIAIWIGSVAFLRLDPWRVGYWFMD